MKRCNAFQIKLFMTMLMLLDHLAPLVPYEWARVFHIISRPVAVWFAFTAVEGFFHTRSRINYLLRLWGAAAVMQTGNLVLGFLMQAKPELVPENNIFLTLAAGVSVLSLLGAEKKTVWHWLGALALLACGAVFTEGGYLLLPVMLICWLLYDRPGLRSAMLALLFVFMSGTEFQPAPTMSMMVLEYLADNTLACVLAVPFLHLYNGKKGPNSPFARYFFYIFYPVHIWIIAGLSYWLL